MEDDRGDRVSRFGYREQGLELGDVDASAEPAEAREEDELELGDDGAAEPEEEVVEAAVLEVVLDSGAPDPPDATVDDDPFPVVDVREAGEVPAQRAAGSQRSDGSPRLRRADDADLSPCSG